MIDGVVIAISGLTETIGDLENMPERQRIAAVRAINKTADRTRTRGSKSIREQVNFTASYINDRLSVSKRASGRNLEAVITGRSRPTSLARFAGRYLKGRGVQVTVKPGVARYVNRSFVMKLRGAGGELTNRGLAVRTDGSKPKGAYKPVKIADKLWLLYGPSVDQVFKDVATKLVGESGEYLEREFLRLMATEGF